MIANAKLVITDGTDANTASLIVGAPSLADWLPKSPPAANSIWASSPYQDGKHLVSKTLDNVIDTFTLVINTQEMDNTIRELRKFIILLEKAIIYWTDEYNTHKFWLEVRGNCETNVRYAYVVDYSIPEINNPFQPPFGATEGDITLDELQLNIEHTIWTDSLTIGDECVKIFSGRVVAVGGHSDTPVGELTPTCSRGPAVANYWTERPIGFAYAYDASLGTFGDNLADYGIANHNLFPAVPAVGDSFMVCCPTDAPYHIGNPFFNLIINLATKAVDITTVVASISDGAAGWIAITPDYANSNPFITAGAVLGINPINWAPNALWRHDTYNGHLGYWIKFEITAIGGAPTPPIKATTTQVYSVMWSHIQVTANEIKGDISGVIDFLLKTSKVPPTSNIIIGARKYSRTVSDSFSPYIPFNEYRAAPLATVTPAAPIVSNYNPLAYSGWDMNWTEGGVSATHKLATFTLDGPTYSGRYRVFLRLKANVGGTLSYLMLRIYNQLLGYYDTDFHQCAEVMDFGIITFAPELLLTNTAINFSVEVLGYTTGANNIDLYDLIFMPVDDANMEITSDPVIADVTNIIQVKTAITSDPKYGPYGFNLSAAAPFLTVSWSLATNYQLKITVLGSFYLEPNEAYCIYFFIHHGTSSVGAFEYLTFPILGKSQRYTLSRGNE